MNTQEFEDYKKQREAIVKTNVQEAEVKIEKIVKLLEEKLLYKVEEVSYELKTF